MLSLAFLLGIAAFFSPCVFPVIPGYISFITGMTLDELQHAPAANAKWKAGVNAILFGAGFTFVFVSLGVIAGALGSTLESAVRVIRYAGAFAILLLGVHLLGLLPIPALLRERRFNPAAHAGSKAGAVIVGVAFGAAWTPCVGPLVAALLLYASVQAHVMTGALLLFGFSVGLGVPFLIAAVLFNGFLDSARLRRAMLPLQRAAGAALMVTGVLMLARMPAQTKAVPAVSAAALEVNPATPPQPVSTPPHEHAVGDTAAPVRVTEVSDFTCGYCGQFDRDVFPRIAKEFVSGGRVHWTFLAAPRPEVSGAMEAARAAECAGDYSADAFWRFKDMVFARQRAWRSADNLKDVFANYAVEAGVDRRAFETCFGSRSAHEAVAASAARAEQMRVRLRPTFFVNGMRVEGALEYEDFRAVLVTALKGY